MKLRDYQQEAIDAILRDAKRYKHDNLLVGLPTGTGKSVVIGKLCEEVANRGGRVLVLARTKELVQQNHDRYVDIDPEGHKRAGIYSAGLNLRMTKERVIFASVQSVCKRMDELGKFNVIWCDECHQIPRNEDSQYQQLIRDARELNPSCRVWGCTATPYRLDCGVIHGPTQLFHRMSYNAPLGVMFDRGYLTKPETLDVDQVDLSGVSKSAGDFNKTEMQTRFLGRSISGEIKAAADQKGMKKIIVFASGVAHAELIKEELRLLGETVHLITGETLPLLRETSISAFSSDGPVRWLVNVDCLTTGFDAPNIDGIVIARGTESPGLFMQMVGRGTRLYPGKEKFYVIDYGGNIERHGPVDSEIYGIDTIKLPAVGKGDAPKRTCPKCFALFHASANQCPECGLEMPPVPKEFIATKKSITVQPSKHRVVHTDYKIWKGKETGEVDDKGRPIKKPDTLLVQYKLHVPEDAELTGRKRWAREWVCIEHSGYAREKAEQWWGQRSSTPCPETLPEALMMIDAGNLAKTEEITLRPEGKYERITKCVVGNKPPVREIGFSEEVPF